MPTSLITINVSDPSLLVVTPSALSVSVETGSSYTVSFLPAQGYRVRVADSVAWDSGPTPGMVTHTFVPATPTLTVNAVVEEIPIAVENVDLVTLARYYSGETIPAGGTETDTFFTDGVVGGVIMQANSNIFRAVARLWMMKAAEYARLIDLDEMGSIRKLTQRYKQAVDMAENFTKAADVEDEAAAGRVRVGPVTVNLRGTRTAGWRVDGPWFGAGWAVVQEFWSITDVLPPLTRRVDKVAPM